MDEHHHSPPKAYSLPGVNAASPQKASRKSLLVRGHHKENTLTAVAVQPTSRKGGLSFDHVRKTKQDLRF